MLVLTHLPNNCRPTDTKQINQRQAPATTVQVAPSRKVGTMKHVWFDSLNGIAYETDQHLATLRRSVYQTLPDNMNLDITLFYLGLSFLRWLIILYFLGADSKSF